MKTNKAGFWVMIGFALAFLIAGIVLVALGMKAEVSLEDNGLLICGLLLLFIALTFGLCSISVLSQVKKQQRQIDAVNAFIAQHLNGNGVFLTGVYSKEGEAGKAAAKSAASILGGAFFAIFFGFGAYKIYGSGTAMGFIVSDNGIYIFNAGAFNPSQMTFMQKGMFPDSEIKVKKNQVTMTNTNSKEFFNFNTANSGITSEQLAEKLKALITATPVEAEAAPADPFGQTDNTASPFEEFSEAPAADAPQSSPETQSTPEADGKSE